MDEYDIYLDDFIDPYFGFSLSSLKKELKDKDDVDVINLYINSPGGSVSESVAIYNFLQKHPAKINTFVLGEAYSMASYLLQVGEKRVMPDNTIIMIHNPWSYAIGDSNELRKQANILDKFQKLLLKGYSRSGQNEEKLIEIMDEETWLTADEALELGFVDEVTSSVELPDLTDLNACINKDVSSLQNPNGIFEGKKVDFYFKNVPEHILNRSNAKLRKGNIMPEAKNKPATQKVNKVAGDQNISAEEKQKAIDYGIEQGILAERKRQNQISQQFAAFSDEYNDLKDKCLADSNISIDQARNMLLNEMGSKQKSLSSVSIVEDERDKTNIGMQAAIQSKCGLLDSQQDSQQSGNEFKSMTLSEMAKFCVRNQDISGLSRSEIVSKAFASSTSDFPNILQSSINKSLAKGFDEVENTFAKWTSKGSLSNFHQAKRVDLGGMEDLDEMPEGSEYKYGGSADTGETVSISSFGKLFMITRQAIINDDLDLFGKVPRKQGQAAARTVGNKVYELLGSNPVMSDGVVTFHEDHHNLNSGADSALSIDSLVAAEIAMMNQKYFDKTVQVIPKFAICPTVLKSKFMQLINSTSDMRQDNPNISNPVSGMVEVIADSRLDLQSKTAFYLIGDPNLYDGIQVNYLDGVEKPRFERQTNWNNDGVEYKVALDFGVSVIGYQSMYKSTGA